VVLPVPTGDDVTNREVLVSGLGRIRDGETARDGSIVLLLEHHEGSRIARIVPVE
jgi:glucose/arabinose dehydrogenase